MKGSKNKISHLFPGKVLTNEEVHWVRQFIGHFGFEPLYTDEVIDEKSFYQMTRKNHYHVEEFVRDGQSILSAAARELPYHDDYAYPDTNL